MFTFVLMKIRTIVRAANQGTGMLLKAAEEHSLNLANCIVIGDRWKDLVAARAAGASMYFSVNRGWARHVTCTGKMG